MFEKTLVPDRSTRRTWQRSGFLPAALAVHGAGLLAVLGASLWNVEDPPEPPVPITWVLPVRDAPAPRAAAKGAPRSEASRGAPRSVAAPVEVPETIPVAGSLAETMPQVGVPGDGPAGAPSGRDGEGPGEAGSGVPGGPGEAPHGGSLRGILEPRGDVHAPVLVRRVEPVYPEAARKGRLEGDVALEAIITPEGEIEEVRVLKSAGALLDSSARTAVERWKYRPATLNGRAVRVLLTVTISFRLQ